MESILNTAINSTILTLIGLGLNLAGVCLLAYEVWLAQKTEFFFLYMRKALREAENLHDNPVQQGRSDIEAARKDMHNKTPAEQLAWRIQEAILRNDVPSWLEDGMKNHAKELINEIKKRNNEFDDQVTPRRLELRKCLLRLGFLFIIIGIVLQSVGTYSGAALL
ncbi:hypothetical protein LG200_09900 [Methylobacillus caricis]|uniref:hypothetical protein n=1 Tax=Methylobacillus caricis TaxID=1971611 RepID=UPI001D000ED7|nr:hypothetical protein [Methylobacillus caricis]MCB5188311.1 hypothetical protein [Methylobacillus caricis]